LFNEAPLFIALTKQPLVSAPLLWSQMETACFRFVAVEALLCDQSEKLQSLTSTMKYTNKNKVMPLISEVTRTGH